MKSKALFIMAGLVLIYARTSFGAACTEINTNAIGVGQEYAIATGTINGTASSDSGCFDLGKSGAAFSLKGICTGTTINVSVYWQTCTTADDPCDTANFETVPIDETNGTVIVTVTGASPAAIGAQPFWPPFSRFARLRTTGNSGNGSNTQCTWAVGLQGYLH